MRQSDLGQMNASSDIYFVSMPLFSQIGTPRAAKSIVGDQTVYYLSERSHSDTRN
jgi:hypothetical protein